MILFFGEDDVFSARSAFTHQWDKSMDVIDRHFPRCGGIRVPKSLIRIVTESSFEEFVIVITNNGSHSGAGNYASLAQAGNSVFVQLAQSYRSAHVQPALAP